MHPRQGLTTTCWLTFALAGACSNPPPPASPTEAAAAEPPPAGDTAAPAETGEATETPPAKDLLTPANTAAKTSGNAQSRPADTRGKTEIQQTVADHRHKVRACYDAVLPDNPGASGSLVVSFVINPDGSVKNAEVNWAESDLHIPELDICAVEAIKTVKFPPSSRGLESKVNYPFDFKPSRPSDAPSVSDPIPKPTNKQ